MAFKLKTYKINNNSNKTIGEIYDEYLDYCKSIGQRKGTIDSKIRFGKYELTKLVNLNDNVSELTYKKIQNHINGMINQGYKGNTYQTFVIKLKAFLTYCFNRDYLEKFEVKIPNILLEKKEIYTETEINKLLKKPNLNTCVVGDYRSWATVNFLLGTGCRSTTLLNVHVKDIDFINDAIKFRHMKTKRQVIVLLPNSLKVVLKEYIVNMGLKDDDFLFPKLDGTQMSYDTLHQNLVCYFKHCKVKMRGINTFRNTFATMFIKNGGDIYRLKACLHHTKISTTERYVNLLPLDISDDILQYNPLDVISKANRKIKINRKSATVSK